MMSGKMNDVNNTINYYDVYAAQMDMPRDIGVPMTGSMTAPTNEMNAGGGGAVSNNAMVETLPPGALGKPITFWFALVGIFALFVWAARKYGGGDSYSNIRASVYNLFFLTVFIVIMLNFLKVVASKWNIPGFSMLVLAA